MHPSIPDDAACDVVGIGFGPANLGLAIALEERARHLSAVFVDSKARFGWHDDMLLPRTTMQVSFLKDLALQRNPGSRYTFLHYLHERGRLADFINLKTFFPSRREFHGYLSWAAERVPADVRYDTVARQIDWIDGKFAVTMVHGETGEQSTIRARHVVVGAGITPVLPPGVRAGARVFHNHRLLRDLARLPERRHGRFLVVGSGQSAAEVAAYLHETYPGAEIHVSIRRFGFLPADDTPYANRVFDSEAVDDFYGAAPALKAQILDNHRSTNYSVVDAELIGDLYGREYDERVAGARRFYLHRLTEIAALDETPDGVRAQLRPVGGGGASDALEVDAVVCATGFAPASLTGILGPSIDRAGVFDGGLPVVARDYSVPSPQLGGRLFLNGGVEHSHGLSATLLSNIAVRTGEIADALACSPTSSLLESVPTREVHHVR